jgi:hypothetical protein
MSETYLNKPRYQYTHKGTNTTYTSTRPLTKNELNRHFGELEKAGINGNDPQQKLVKGQTPHTVLEGFAKVLDRENKTTEYTSLAENLDITENYEALEDEYYERMRMYEWRTTSAVDLGFKLRGDYYNQEEKSALNLMFNNWEQTVPFYKQETGKVDALLDFGEAVATDWGGLLLGGAPTLALTLFKNTAGKGVVKAALRKQLEDSLKSGMTTEAAEQAVKKTLKKEMVKDSAYDGAKFGAIEGAIVGSVHDVALAEGKEEIGIGEGASITSALKSAVGGAVFGGILGGGIGVGSGVARATSKKKVDSELQSILPERADVETLVEGSAKGKKPSRTSFSDQEKIYAAREQMELKQAKETLSKERRKIYDEFRNMVSKTTSNKLPAKKQLAQESEDKMIKFVESISKPVTVKDLQGNKRTTYEVDIETSINKMYNKEYGREFLVDTIAPVAQVLQKAQSKKVNEAQQAFSRIDPKANPKEYKAAKMSYRRELDLFEEITYVYDESVGAAGRGLNKIQRRNQPKKIREIYGADNTVQIFDTALEYINITGDAGAASDLVNKLRKMGEEVAEENVKPPASRKIQEAINDVYVHNLMNAPSTPFVNFVSSYLRNITDNVEGILAGTLKGSSQTAMMSYKRAMRQGKYMQLALESAKNVLLTGDSTISRRTFYDVTEEAKTVADEIDFSQGFMKGMSESSTYEKAMTANRFISKRMMIAGDDINKTISFTTKLEEMLVTDLLKDPNWKGKSIKEIYEHAEQQTRLIHRDVIKKRMAGEDLIPDSYEDKALKYAEEMTFQEDPHADIFGQVAEWTNAARSRVPILTQIMPFIRTPANLLSYTSDRTPVMQMFSKTLRDKLNSPDAAIRAKAEASMVFGSVIWGSVMMMAASGMITGKPPTDKGKRETRQLDDDYLPYSIEGVSIRRFDPLARFAMIAGVIHDTVMYQDEQTQMELFGELAAGTAMSLLEMPALDGLETVAKFINPNTVTEQSLTKAATTQLSNYMPFVRLFEEIYSVQGKERYMPENIKLADAFLGRPHLLNLGSPAYDGKIDLKRDNVFGDLIVKPHGGILSHLGITMKQKELDPVKEALIDEFIRLDLSIPPNPKSPNMFYGFNLTSIGTKKGRSYYDVFKEKTGTVKIGSRTLQQALDDLVNESRDYHFAPDGNTGGSLRARQNKGTLIKSIINTYRNKALQDMYPELMQNREFEQHIKFNKQRQSRTQIFTGRN